MHSIKPKYEYLVIQESDISYLNRSANEYLNRNWECCGDIQIHSTLGNYGTRSLLYCQKLMREIKKK